MKITPSQIMNMLTMKIKSSESSIAFKRISQLRRSDSSNSAGCQCDQQKHREKIQIKPLVSKIVQQRWINIIIKKKWKLKHKKKKENDKR